MRNTYPHCSVNSIFKKEMGKKTEEALLHPRYHHRYIGKTAKYPDRYKMNESGKADYRRPTDIDVCTLIDRTILPRYCKSSVYLLTEKEKQIIAEYIYRRYHIMEPQIRRCLAM